MQKPVLGRNLGSLLGGKKPEQPGAGVRSLMRGSQTEPAQKIAPAIAPTISPTTAPTTAPKPPTSIPNWYLFGADLLLVALALLILWKSSGPLSWKERLFCIGSVVVGGCLAVVAVLRRDKS